MVDASHHCRPADGMRLLVLFDQVVLHPCRTRLPQVPGKDLGTAQPERNGRRRGVVARAFWRAAEAAEHVFGASGEPEGPSERLQCGVILQKALGRSRRAARILAGAGAMETSFEVRSAHTPNAHDIKVRTQIIWMMQRWGAARARKCEYPK